MKFTNLILPLTLLATPAFSSATTSIWNNDGGNAAHTGYFDVKTDPINLKCYGTEICNNKIYRCDGIHKPLHH